MPSINTVLLRGKMSEGLGTFGLFKPHIVVSSNICIGLVCKYTEIL